MRLGNRITIAPAGVNLMLAHQGVHTQPILPAMDAMADHRDGYSAQCFSTQRTAWLFPPELEPLRNAGRFIVVIAMGQFDSIANTRHTN